MDDTGKKAIDFTTYVKRMRKLTGHFVTEEMLIEIDKTECVFAAEEKLANYLREQFKNDDFVREYVIASLELFLQDRNKELFLTTIEELLYNGME